MSSLLMSCTYTFIHQQTAERINVCKYLIAQALDIFLKDILTKENKRLIY